MAEDSDTAKPSPPLSALSYHQRALEMRDQLNQVSSCFCVAKFKQVTLHLQNGLMHSCHHPIPHRIPLEELSNPAALANTVHLKRERKKMLAGERPKECEYCWNIEDNSNALSDRSIKSAEYWARDQFAEASTTGADKDFLPAYLEVSFSNACQLKCLYCSPAASSSWQLEINKNGAFRLGDGRNYFSEFEVAHEQRALEEDSNPYVAAFWKWWPELYPGLKVFRITGGEPLLSQSTYRALEWVAANPRRDLQIGINSNLAVPPAVLDRFMNAVEPIAQENAFERFTIFSSIDTFGAPAEYLRSGLDSQIWLSYVNRLFERLPNIHFTIMCTFNALSVSNFDKFLKVVLNLKQRYAQKLSDRVMLDIPYLRYPEFLSVAILNKHHLEKLERLLDQMHELNRFAAAENLLGFHQMEFEKMQRLIDWAKVKIDPRRCAKLRRDFVAFIQEIDKRRGSNFLKTFPDMRDLWLECEAAGLSSEPDSRI